MRGLCLSVCCLLLGVWPTFEHLPIVRSWLNCYGRCILENLISGHSQRLTLTQGQGHRGQKHAIFGHFFELCQTPPTVFNGLIYCYKGMCTVDPCTISWKRNFEFLPQRSCNWGQRSNVDKLIWPTYWRPRVIIFTGWIHIGKVNITYGGQGHGVKVKVTGVISIFEVILAIFLNFIKQVLQFSTDWAIVAWEYT